jgi:predicted small secreted protein
MASPWAFVRLIMILAAGVLTSCSNAIPTVDSLTSTTAPQIVDPKDAKNFMQINAGSKKETLGSGYKGNIRISQAVGNTQAVSSGGHKLKGTVTLQH